MSEESFGTFKALFSRPAAFGPYVSLVNLPIFSMGCVSLYEIYVLAIFSWEPAL